MGIGTSVASVALGVCIIEKHFTLNRADGGVDASFSLEPEEFKNLVIEVGRAFYSLGEVKYELTEKEKKSLQFKRSLYVVKDLKDGDILSTENVRSIRPGYGLHTRYYESILGRKVKTDIKAGTPISFELFN
jgi:N-acetylneuraminate synthase